jgi:hypothetical protein
MLVFGRNIPAVTTMLHASYAKKLPGAYCYDRFGYEAVPDVTDAQVKMAWLQAHKAELFAKILRLESRQKGASVLKYLPWGWHILWSRGDRREVFVDERSALELEAQRWSIISSGRLPFFRSLTTTTDRHFGLRIFIGTILERDFAARERDSRSSQSGGF